MPWSDCANAQADLGIRCSLMPEETFLNGAAYVVKIVVWWGIDYYANFHNYSNLNHYVDYVM